MFVLAGVGISAAAGLLLGLAVFGFSLLVE